MCNIVTFRFTCQHTLRRRRSRCGGTKHRITANSIKAACVAESFLTICLRNDCDSCQHRVWEDAWKLKIERAKTFLDGVRERGLPDLDKVEVLVKTLEAEFAIASWNTRNMFAHSPKPKVSRVKHNHYEKAASKLPQEIRPEDVVEKVEQNWNDMCEEDYDGNYVASTDPLHPVSTDYSHPLDNDDGSWILQNLAPDHFEPDLDEVAGFENHSWSWDDTANCPNNEAPAKAWEHTSSAAEVPGLTRDLTDMAMDLVSRSPDAEETSSVRTGMNGGQNGETEQEAGEDEVVRAFWAVVNAEPQPAE